MREKKEITFLLSHSSRPSSHPAERDIFVRFEVRFESDDDVTCEENLLSLKTPSNWYLLIKIDDEAPQNVVAIVTRRWFFFGSNEMINYLQHRQKKPRGSLMWHKSNEASIKLNINSFLLSHTHWTFGENVGRAAHKKMIVCDVCGH